MAPQRIAAYVVTLSDTRDASNDTSGDAIQSLLEAAGHAIGGREILREDPATLEPALQRILARGDVDVVLLTGGTGIAPRDLTYDLLARLYERPLPGFGELFRRLSYDEIGSAAMLSRASAGVASGKAIFSMPGSRGAVRLAMEALVLPELGHVVGELRRVTPSRGANP